MTHGWRDPPAFHWRWVRADPDGDARGETVTLLPSEDAVGLGVDAPHRFQDLGREGFLAGVVETHAEEKAGGEAENDHRQEPPQG